MGKIYGEDDVTWSSIEKDIPYAKVIWSRHSNGISKYTLLDEDDKIIKVEF